MDFYHCESPRGRGLEWHLFSADIILRQVVNAVLFVCKIWNRQQNFTLNLFIFRAQICSDSVILYKDRVVKQCKWAFISSIQWTQCNEYLVLQTISQLSSTLCCSVHQTICSCKTQAAVWYYIIDRPKLIILKHTHINTRNAVLNILSTS